MKHKFFYWVALTLLACVNLTCLAEEVPEDKESILHFSGFGTVGLARSNSKISIVKDLTDPNGYSKHGSILLSDTRVGFQVDANFNAEMSATAQLVLRDRYVDSLKNDLEWAFIKYRPTNQLQFRFGRIGVDQFMLSDQRNVGYTNLWVRLPIEFYGPISIYHYDGADVKYSLPVADGSLETKFSYGRTSNEFTSTESIDLRPLIAGSLLFSNEKYTLRAGYTNITFKSDLPESDELTNGLKSVPSFIYSDAERLVNILELKNTSVQFLSLGFGYDYDNWQILAELSKAKFESQVLSDYDSGFLMGAYRIGNWTPYVSYSKIRPTSPEIHAEPPAFSIPELDALTAGFEAAVDFNRYNQETFSVGTRWDFYPRMALKAQYDHTNIKANGYGLTMYQPDTHKDTSINSLSLALDWIF